MIVSWNIRIENYFLRIITNQEPVIYCYGIIVEITRNYYVHCSYVYSQVCLLDLGESRNILYYDYDKATQNRLDNIQQYILCIFDIMPQLGETNTKDLDTTVHNNKQRHVGQSANKLSEGTNFRA